jgi:hypothetical protein
MAGVTYWGRSKKSKWVPPSIRSSSLGAWALAYTASLCHRVSRLQLLVDNLRDCPAMVMGRWLDVLTWNSLAAAIFRDFAAIPRHQRNFLRMLFLDPQVRDHYIDWHSIARICVGFVRATTEGIVEPHLAALVGELSLRDADFRTWWAERHASYQTRGSKTLTHPETGRYTLDWQVLHSPDDAQTLMVMTAPRVYLTNGVSGGHG